jgi:hypothetical protein
MQSSVSAWTADGILLLRGRYHTLEGCSGARPLCGGPPFGELSGGNWIACGPCRSLAPGTRSLGFRPSLSELLCPIRLGSRLGLGRGVEDSYLVDSASSHMLVSKIKPCMSKYKQSIR